IFDGTHGWFWRNRSNSDVTITLKTKGEYLSVKRVI
ncbi:MAG: transmembrane anchor protein, partial [Gammaproteobacteria bacterium HGW-Gammaproteobacteria-9]